MLILDVSDLFKKYAEKIEYLAKVRDGSDGVTIVNGYWTVQVIGAELGKHEVLPLYQELYSQEVPGFKSENTQIVNTIDMVSGHTGDKGKWIIDRGGDRDVLYSHLLKENSPKRFVIRLEGHRNLVYGNAEELALKLAL